MEYIVSMILAILMLCGGALFFSVNAVALRIFSSAKLHDAFKDKGKESTADKLIDDSEKLANACALYRMVFNFVIVILVLHMLSTFKAEALNYVDYIIIFFIASTLLYFFSLVIPTAMAKYAGEKILRGSYPVLNFFAVIAVIDLWFWKIGDKLIKRLCGISDITDDRMQEEKEEEFLTDLEQQKIEGVVDAQEQEMIENVLELTDTTAGEILTPRTDVIAIDVKSGLEEILKKITETGHSRYPVYEENIDKITGLIYAKDLLSEIGKEPSKFNLSEKIREAYYVPETKPLRELLNEFKSTKQHIAVVLDEYGGTAGIVTLEDILEELVGEITDEYEEKQTEPVQQIDSNTIEADARTYIDDLNDKYELALPEDEDYDTIGGFVFSHLGYIPKTDEEFQYENLKFKILLAEERKIVRIKIQKLPKENNA